MVEKMVENTKWKDKRRENRVLIYFKDGGYCRVKLEDVRLACRGGIVIDLGSMHLYKPERTIIDIWFGTKCLWRNESD